MENKKAEQVALELVDYLEFNLENLQDTEPDELLAYGMKVGYAEILTTIRNWDKSRKFGIDYDISKRFPL